MKWFKTKKEIEEEQSNLAAAVQGNIEFALDLYQKLRLLEGNLIFSPYSISTALAMTYAGAHAVTQTQMAEALHFLPDQNQLHPAFAHLEARLEEAGKKGHVQLRVANTLWPRKGSEFLKAFLTLTKKFYGVRITSVDFGDIEAARLMINSWVEERTENKIKDLIAAGVLDDSTRLVLVNAIYFKGEWADRFDPGLTNQAPFLTLAGSQAQVPMMNLKHTFRYAEDDGLQALELPYSGGDLSMFVLLPREVNGLARLEESLETKNLDKWKKNLQETEVEVSLPRFELTFPFRLDDTLKSMGMKNAFSTKADFSGMDGTQELYLGAVLHKAFVAVNEQGTEAAAATAVAMQTKALAFSPIIFRADHPFVFFIHDNSSGSILFIGRMVNPA
jgi:serine protease inhibitor